MQNKETIVILSLGSNIGDRRSNLEKAVEHLQYHITTIKSSKIIETEPMYFFEQNSFYNQVVMGKTTLNANKIHTIIKKIEIDLGRTVTHVNGPRVIDIDILYFGNQIIETNDLIIPHLRIAERMFVLKPLLEIAPLWRCPKHKNTVQEMFNKLSGG